MAKASGLTREAGKWPILIVLWYKPASTTGIVQVKEDCDIKTFFVRELESGSGSSSRILRLRLEPLIDGGLRWTTVQGNHAANILQRLCDSFVSKRFGICEKVGFLVKLL
jgi:hypothetical protein